MISVDDFNMLVKDALGRNLDSNEAQRDSIYHDNQDVLLLVAGPGSGKTTVLVLRALRHVLVDDILPENILITTFTRKAAKELRSRWLEWGTKLIDSLKRDTKLEEAIKRIDINRCRVDTLDSIAQQTLTEFRLPGEVAPILLDGSASKLILKRTAFRNIYSADKDNLDRFFSRYSFSGSIPENQGKALDIAKSICERLIHDLVDLDRYARGNTEQQKIVEMLRKYMDHLQNTNLYDFATLELKLLERLLRKELDQWVDSIKVLLIDEYQDTNPLQETIYYRIISASNPLVTVVGDDDQSMYRFRGGSVELFTKFHQRCADATGRNIRRINLVTNYRSSGEIVDFYNEHITGDPRFTPARIVPSKPEVISIRGNVGVPVIGLFRNNPEAIANDLAEWISKFLTDRKVILDNNGISYELTLPQEGNLGDCVLLAHSIEEIKYARFNSSAETRFAGYFRRAMSNRGMRIFNPRGQALRTIASVQQLLGMVLLCIDPNEVLTNNAYPTNEARYFISQWRYAAIEYIAHNPSPSSNGGLRKFVEDWGRVSRGIPNSNFPNEWPSLELIFKLITWMPGFQGDPEHQVWLEAVTRTISCAGMASPYGMQFYNTGVHLERSRESFIRDALLPIAENEVDVDEDIMPSVPRNWIQLMTIHQSKGLEFPLVIVDVGCHFKQNHPQQKFLRFPDKPSNVTLLEDDLENYIPSPLRGGRTPIDRSFDDLMRLYYVAYSRPQSVLMLVGCEACLTYGRGKQLSGAIPNIALGWNRDGTWDWRQPNSGKQPIQVDAPLLLI